MTSHLGRIVVCFSFLLPVVAAADPVLTVQFPDDNGAVGPCMGAVDDYDGDGRLDLLFGDSRYNNTGIAQILSSSTGAVLRTFPSPNSYAGNSFGETATAIDDLTGDGRQEILIGAGDENSTDGPAKAGRAYIFSGDPTVSAPLFVLKSPNELASGGYGHGVQRIADLTGDGQREFAVTTGSEGFVYVYDGVSRQLIRSFAPLGSPSANPSLGRDQYDVTGDGVPDLLMNCPGETVNSVPDSGRAYLIDGATGSVLHAFAQPVQDGGGSFGAGAAIIPDYTGDGVADIAISEPVGNSALHLFNGATYQLIRTFATGADGMGFGPSAMDVDRDGIMDLGHSAGSYAGCVVFDNYPYTDETARIWPYWTDWDNQELLATASALPDLEGDGIPNILVQALSLGWRKSSSIVYNGLTTKWVASKRLPNGEWTPAVTSLNFGERDPGDGATWRSFTYTATGELPVKFLGDGFAITGPDAADFSFAFKQPTTPLRSHDSRFTTITFDPSRLGTSNATLEIYTNADDTTRSISLVGVGAPNPPAYARPVYLANGSEIILIDSDTGTRHLFSSPLRGTGPTPTQYPDQNQPGAWWGLTAGSWGRVYGYGNVLSFLAELAPNGDRTQLMMNAVTGVPLAAGTSLFYFDDACNIVSRDMIAGTSRVVSKNGYRVQGVARNGPAALENPNSLLYPDPNLTNLVRVNIATGERTLLPVTTKYVDFTASRDGRIFAVDGASVVFQIDAATGAATVISSNERGAGPAYVGIDGLAMATPRDDLFVYDSKAGSLLRVSIATGDRTIVSSDEAGVGTGPSIVSPGGTEDNGTRSPIAFLLPPEPDCLFNY